MKKSGLLNAQLIEAIASIGHTQHLTIADVGLPIPRGVRCIDLSLVPGVPSFLTVVKAVCDEMVVESYVIASELAERRPNGHEELQHLLAPLPGRSVPHETLKEMIKDTYVVVRTGATESFANVLLVAGVNF